MEVAISEISKKSHRGAGPTFRRAGSLAKGSLCGPPQEKRIPFFVELTRSQEFSLWGVGRLKEGRRVYELVIGFELDLEKKTTWIRDGVFKGRIWRPV